jgi:hypothetical protein
VRQHPQQAVAEADYSGAATSKASKDGKDGKGNDRKDKTREDDTATDEGVAPIWEASCLYSLSLREVAFPETRLPTKENLGNSKL